LEAVEVDLRELLFEPGPHYEFSESGLESLRIFKLTPNANVLVSPTPEIGLAKVARQQTLTDCVNNNSFAAWLP
jgi:hypothetical protein